jgi:hypothetical protein
VTCCRGRQEGYAAAILDDHKRVRKAKEEAAAIAKAEAEVNLLITVNTTTIDCSLIRPLL